MRGSDLVGTGKLTKECVNGSHMERWNQFFEFRKEDADKSRNGSFQPGTLLNLVEPVSCERFQFFIVV
jgi:hypothetical protein